MIAVDNPTERRVLEALAGEPGPVPRWIIVRRVGMRDRTVRAAIARLHKRGLIRHVSGAGVAGDPKLWAAR